MFLHIWWNDITIYISQFKKNQYLWIPYIRFRYHRNFAKICSESYWGLIENLSFSKKICQNFIGNFNKTFIFLKFRYTRVCTKQTLLYKGIIHSFHIPQILSLLLMLLVPLIPDKTLEFLHLLAHFDRHLYWKRLWKKSLL